MVRFTVTAGQTVDFDIDTTTNGGTGLQSYLRIFNSSGAQLAANDNATAPGEGTVGFDAYLRYTSQRLALTMWPFPIRITPLMIR